MKDDARNTLSVTFFENEYATSLTTAEISIWDLRSRFLTTVAPTKEQLPLLKLAKFGDKRTDANCLRNNANVKSINGIELDYDGQQVSFDAAVATIKKLRLQALVYTSPSHGEARPRWRVVVPTSRDLAPTERAKLVARLNGAFNGVFSSESFTLSQSFYYGMLDGNSATHRAEYRVGDFIDQRSDLDATAIYKRATKSKVDRIRLTDATGIRPEQPITSLDDERLQSISDEARHMIVTNTPPAGKPHLKGGKGHCFVVGALVRAGLSNAQVKEVYRLGAIGNGPASSSRGFSGYIERVLAVVRSSTNLAARILNPANPMHSARELVATNFTKGGTRILHRHRGAFWSWTGSYFELIEQETVRTWTWNFLDKARRFSKQKTVPFQPKANQVNEVADALRAVCQLDAQINPPAWLDDDDDSLPPSCEFFACANGLLHLPTGELYSATPKYFGVSASEIRYDEDAPPPKKWLAFLEQIFGDDEEAIGLLQEWFGYSLAADTSQQKILLMVGPRRSGKGTIARVLKGLLGQKSVAGPTMHSLGETFGLEPLITKPLAIIADMRIGKRTEKSTIVERLLAVSGEDTLTVGRKFKDAWHGMMMTRLMILTNILPSLNDDSGALAGRFLVLQMSKSFFGREDPTLTGQLLVELPGILNWAVEGHRRLRERGYFILPESGQDAVDDIEVLASPVKGFIGECCIVEQGAEIAVNLLWQAYKAWAKAQGHLDSSIGSKEWFGRNLRAAEPGVTVKRPERDGGDRLRVYSGIKLRDCY